MFRSRIQIFSRIIATQGRMAMSAATSSLPVESTKICVPNCVDESYENAVKTLNTLQSNSETIAKIRQNQNAKRSSNLPQTLGALHSAGLSLDMIDTLGVIHVAGTKGKGMTCAFTESILRQAGLKTGFFSSPHLTSVRERIRIDGKPLSRSDFSKHFFFVYNKLKHLKEPNAPYEMPHYFRFLTCMAFQVFLEEKVDAVILEVGIGGMFDTTNIVRKPVVVGITSLGLEHQVILGNTLEEIAIQKAGIMKEGTPAYTIEPHPPHIMKLLRLHAEEVKCPIYCAPTEDFNSANVSIKLGVNDGVVSGINAGLAVHLANEFLLRKHPYLFPSLTSNLLPASDLIHSTLKHYLPFHVKGLESTKWDGRFQMFPSSDNVMYFLDGAHTIDSLNVTVQWFSKVASPSAIRILVFNLTGERPAHSFLKPFAESGLIDLAIFCPVITSTKTKSLDNWAALDADKDPMELCKSHVKIWESLPGASEAIVRPCAESTINYISQLAASKTENVNSINVLITGSLRLVGTFLSVLDPQRNED